MESDFISYLIYQNCQTSKYGKQPLCKFSFPFLWPGVASLHWPPTTNSRTMWSGTPSLSALETVWPHFLQVCNFFLSLKLGNKIPKFSRIFWQIKTSFFKSNLIGWKIRENSITTWLVDTRHFYHPSLTQCLVSLGIL